MGERIMNGLSGFDEIADTNPHSATTSGTDFWEHIVILEDAKFAALTGGNITGFGADPVDANARVYTAGDQFAGKITAFTLHSGRVRAYRRSS